jgi:hypothetical protein
MCHYDTFSQIVGLKKVTTKETFFFNMYHIRALYYTK